MLVFWFKVSHANCSRPGKNAEPEWESNKFQKTISQYLSSENLYNWIILKKFFKFNYICFYRKVSSSFCRRFLWSYFFLYQLKMFPHKILVTYQSAESFVFWLNIIVIWRIFLQDSNKFSKKFLKTITQYLSAENFYKWIILMRSFF